MNFDIYDLLLIFPLLLAAMYWWRTSGQKSTAMAGARAYCKERQLQLLDETLVFRNYRMERRQNGKRRLCRVYEFDYSKLGEDRQNGTIMLDGHHILRVILHGDALEITEAPL